MLRTTYKLLFESWNHKWRCLEIWKIYLFQTPASTPPASQRWWRLHSYYTFHSRGIETQGKTSPSPSSWTAHLPCPTSSVSLRAWARTSAQPPISCLSASTAGLCTAPCTCHRLQMSMNMPWSWAIRYEWWRRWELIYLVRQDDIKLTADQRIKKENQRQYGKIHGTVQ